MPGVPIDGMPPPPVEEKKGGGIGGIFSTLLGHKHHENMQKERNEAEWVMGQLQAFSEGKSQAPDSIVDLLVQRSGKVFGKDFGTALKQHFEQVKAARDLEERKKLLPRQPGAQAPGPVMPAAQPDIRAGGSTPGEGMPPPPFEQGAEAGAASQQANPVAEMKVGSQLGTQGFGGPAAPPPSQGNIFYKGPVQQGVDMAAIAGPTLRAKGDVEREDAAKNYAAAKARYESEPWFKKLSDAQQAEVLSGNRITAMPHFTIPGVTMSIDGDVGIDGQPVAVGTPGKRSYMNGQWSFIPDSSPLHFEDRLNPDGTKSTIGVNRRTGITVSQNKDLVSAPIVRTIKVEHLDGTTSQIGVTQTGQVVSDDPKLRGINFAALPKENENLILVPQRDGSYDLVPKTSVTRPVLPSSLTPPPGAAPSIPGTPAATPATAPPAPSRPGVRKNVGAKSLTPGQEISLGGKLSAFEQTLDLANSVKSALPLLNNLVDAKKIDFQIDPSQGIIKALVNRGMPLSDDEAKLAGDFANLMEHINTLRIPLGAAGFRGHEAFAALQAQRGQLMANPRVTQRILENTIKTLMGQIDVIRKGLNPQGLTPPPPGDGMTPPPNAKPMTAEEFLKKYPIK